MFKRVADCIAGQRLLRAGDRLAIAVSGGADSVALLRILLELRDELGIVLSMAHLHHGIRGAEGEADAQFVRDLASSYGLPLHFDRVDAPAHAAANRLSLETAARELRYAFFGRLLSDGVVDKIATAHTLDDQAETVLLRLLRGTGTHGLAGISLRRDAGPDSAGQIIRPLLGISRAEIETYLHSLQQPWREDSSNTDLHHFRNRVRHELLPLLEREYNSQIRVALANLAEIARAEEEVWQIAVQNLTDRIAARAPGKVRIARRDLLAEPLAVQRRLLAAALERLQISAGFADIDRITRIAQIPGGQHQIGAEWSLVVRGDALEFCRTAPAAPPVPYEYPLPVPGELRIPETGQTLRAWMRDFRPAPGYNPATSLALERLTLPLRVRNWQPGDRYWPLGNKQPEKLKRLFQQKRIPSPARSRWPVVLSGSSIVWVPGFPVAYEYAAGGSTAVCMEAVVSDAAKSREP